MNEQNYTKPAKRHTLRNIAVGAILFAAGCGVGGASSSDTPASSSPAPTATATVTATVTATTESTVTATPTQTASAAELAAAEWGDGVYEVGTGKDIAPGTYKVRVNDDFGCYVEQSKDASGELDSIVSNDIIDGASGYVTVTAKANYLTVSGCTLTRKGK